MTDKSLGNLVTELFQGARGHAVICAPFIKEAPLQKVLSSLDSAVSIQLFTRWRPEEVAAGVSDTGVLSLIERRGGSVRLYERLHAKLFRADEKALVGSANLTGSALGWVPNPNLELLIEVTAETPAVVALETALADGSVLATAALAAEVERVAASLPSMPQGVEIPDTREVLSSVATWHPLLREPADLFIAYSQGSELLSSASLISARTDLAALDLPPGLTREPFELLVANRLRQSALIREIDDKLSEPRRFGEMSQLIGDRLELGHREAQHTWQTLMRWLMYFLPERYNRAVPSHSEIMMRSGELDP